MGRFVRTGKKMGHANSKIATDVYIQLSDSYQSKQNTKTLDEATACGVYIFTVMHPILVMSYKKAQFPTASGLMAFQRSNVRQLCIKYIASEALVKSRTFGLLNVPFFLPPFPRARCGSLLGIYLTQISLPFSMSNESPTFRVSICNEESERITYRKRKDIHVRQMSGCARMCAK